MGVSDGPGRPDALPDRDVSALLRELDLAHAREAATGRILRVIARSPADLQSVLDAIAESAVRLCEASDAVIMRVTDAGIMPMATRGKIGKQLSKSAPAVFPPEPRRLTPDIVMTATMPVWPLHRGWVGGRAAVDRQTVHVLDLAHESEAEYPIGKAAAARFGHRTSLATPLLRDGQVIGVIGVFRTEVRPFSDSQIRQLETFADQAAIAIENARLLESLQQQTAALAELNQTLESRIREQLEQLERVGRLRRYLSPQVVDLILASGDEVALTSHRRQITVLFCDLRGFTAFAETAEPEEVMGVLGEYHAALGALIHHFQGTIEHFEGDGLMVFFNDPLPQSDHAERAVRMAVAMRERVGELSTRWRRQGHELSFSVGIAMGYATLGRIGFEGRFDYAAIGSVTNLAARLCGEAAGGDILISGRVYALVEGIVEADSRGEVLFKGFHRPLAVFNVRSLKDGDLAA